MEGKMVATLQGDTVQFTPVVSESINNTLTSLNRSSPSPALPRQYQSSSELPAQCMFCKVGDTVSMESYVLKRAAN